MSSYSNRSYLHYAIGASEGRIYQEEIARPTPSDFPSTDVARYTISSNDLVVVTGRDGTPEFHLELGLRYSLWQALVKTVVYLFRTMNGLVPSAGGSINTCPLQLPPGLCRNLHMLPPTLPPIYQIRNNPFEDGMEESELLEFAYEWQGLILKMQAWITEAKRRIDINPDSFPFNFSPLPTIEWDEVSFYDEEQSNDMDTLVNQLGDEYFEINFTGHSGYSLPHSLSSRLFIAGSGDEGPVRVVDTGSKASSGISTPSPVVSPTYSPSISSFDDDATEWDVDEGFESAYPEVVLALTRRRALVVEAVNDK